MKDIPLYPLRFEPLCQYRLWGGRRLMGLLSQPVPGNEPIGEAWLLSDREDHCSQVADGPLKGTTITYLMKRSPRQLLGPSAARCGRFPLLLKYLDVQKELSVQVHPSDVDQNLIPPGETGKTEAWVVLQTGSDARIFAGLKPAASAAVLRQSIVEGRVAGNLAWFTPTTGDAILIPAGTVHSLRDVVVFEVQRNSDVTFRLYDWDHIDLKTGQRRCLHVDQALACIDFSQGARRPIIPHVEESGPVTRARLLHCEYFSVMRITGDVTFMVGAEQRARILVCLAGRGQLEHAGATYAFRKGDVHLLPAVVGVCACRPEGPVSVLEVALPEVS